MVKYAREPDNPTKSAKVRPPLALPSSRHQMQRPCLSHTSPHSVLAFVINLWHMQPITAHASVFDELHA